MSLFSLRPFSPECIPALLELHAANAAFYPEGDQERYCQSLLELQGLFLCLYDQDFLIAAGGLQKHQDYWWLHSLDVHPSRQRQGWGRRLITALLASLDSEGDEICTVGLNSTPSAEAFYRRLGFTAYLIDDGFLHFYRHIHPADLRRLKT
ncbi:MAG: Acetyltransferase domain [Verrucomicrobiota bacterium]|jgi:GNAT superfamily N-acetyltransferase